MKHVRVWNTYFAKEYMKDLNAFFWDKRSHRIKNAIFLSWEGTYHTGCNQFPNPLPTIALIQQCSRLFHTHIHRSTLQSEPGVMHKSWQIAQWQAHTSHAESNQKSRDTLPADGLRGERSQLASFHVRVLEWCSNLNVQHTNAWSQRVLNGVEKSVPGTNTKKSMPCVTTALSLRVFYSPS